MNRNQLETLFDLTGRVAIVTGGTKGIGRAIAEGFVAAGARVAVASRKPEACTETEQALRASGGEAIGVPTHLGDLDALRAVVERTVAELGRLDIVVNNAATPLREDLGHFTPEAYAKSMDVNLRGPVFLVQEALPYLQDSPSAAVINVISAGAFLHAPFLATYAATKAALYSFTRSMAAEFAPLGVRVNALAPGSVDTDMMRNGHSVAHVDTKLNGAPQLERFLVHDLAAQCMRREILHRDGVVALHVQEVIDADDVLVSDLARVT